jgi:hypothetical protein
MGSKTGLVLQGYFSVEQFRGPGSRDTAAQAKGSPRPSPQPPRPDLLPVRMRGGAAQAKGTSASPWRGAPRPELMPGMGKPNEGILGRAAQLRSQVGVVTSPVLEGRLRLTGLGKPLEPRLRARMEGLFGADFSGVRVHEGAAAQALGALAFTAGEKLCFAPGLYDPTTPEGMGLLGHELAHVVQQRAGRATNPHEKGMVIVQDPALEAEAGAMASRCASTAQARYMRLGMLAGAYMGQVPGFLLGGALGGFVDAYVGWSSMPQYIDERFPTTLEGTVQEAQRTLRDVSARNSRTISRRISRGGGGELLRAVERAKRRTVNKLCTDFARNLRKELYGEDAPRIPMYSSEVIRTNGLDDIVRKVAERRFPAGTVLLLGNDQNIHTTTIVGVMDGHTIIVEQHPANPQVVFKTMSRAMDEWRLGIALTRGQSEESIAELFAEIGVVPRPI